MPGRVSLTDAQVRYWLVNFYFSERLADQAMRDLLSAHGRPSARTPWKVAEEARALIREKIEALRPADEDAPPLVWRPYRVLSVTFIQGFDLKSAQRTLALSERQMTRERARAVALLRAELEDP